MTGWLSPNSPLFNNSERSTALLMLTAHHSSTLLHCIYIVRYWDKYRYSPFYVARTLCTATGCKWSNYDSKDDKEEGKEEGGGKEGEEREEKLFPLSFLFSSVFFPNYSSLVVSKGERQLFEQVGWKKMLRLVFDQVRFIITGLCSAPGKWEIVSCPDPTQLTRGEGVWCHKSKSLG